MDSRIAYGVRPAIQLDQVVGRSAYMVVDGSWKQPISAGLLKSGGTTGEPAEKAPTVETAAAC